SCTMFDNTDINDQFCESHNIMLFNASGNTGTIEVFPNVPIILHQACFTISSDTTVVLIEDEITDLTVGVDLIPTGFITDYPAYDDFYLDSVVYCEILPVTWLSFLAQIAGPDKSMLTWVTTDEINVDEFEVQRSFDGRNYE